LYALHKLARLIVGFNKRINIIVNANFFPSL
jgi:hypothetical protein